LDKEYPKADRERIKSLDLVNLYESLEGSLKLEGFTNLELLNCSGNKLTNLDISDCSRLEKLDCSYNKIRSLDLNKNNQLVILDCCFNWLVDLDLTGLTELRMLHCSDNCIEKIDYLNLNPDKLVYLNISDNNLLEQDLSVFSRFVNLEELIIGNFEVDKISSAIYNRFYGSLEPLRDLIRLKSIFIKNTDIDSGLEYLPSTVETVYCGADVEFNFGAKSIEEILKGYGVGEEEAKKRENNSGWLKNLFKNKKDKERAEFEDLAVKEFLKEAGYPGYHDFQA
jgi:Leucine-rich repeat (LRR) protein